MADREVTIRLTAEDKVSQPAKIVGGSLHEVDQKATKAGASMKDMGERAAKASEDLLTIEKAKAGLEVIKRVAEIGAAAFAKMSENSAAMRGELGAVDEAFARMAGHLGDSIAQSQGFKEVIDLASKAIEDFDGWIASNSETIEDVFVGSVKIAAQATRALIFSLRGILETIAVAKGAVESLKPEDGGPIHLAAAQAAQSLWMDRNETAARSGDLAVRARYLQELAAWEKKVSEERRKVEGSAGGQVEAQLAQIEKTYRELDGLLAGFAHVGDDQMGPPAPGRATRMAASGSGGGKSLGADPALKIQGDAQARLAAANEAFRRSEQAALWSYEDDVAGEQERRRQEEYESTTRWMQAAADYQTEIWKKADLEREALATAEQQRLDDQAASWAQFSAVTDQAMATVTTGLESFGASQEAMARVTMVTTAIQAGIKAGYEAAEAVAAFARYDYGSGALHALAATQYTIVAGSNTYQALGGGGGGAGSRGGASGGGYSSGAETQRVSTSREEQRVVTYEIHQHFHGSYSTEGEAGRKIQDAIRSAQRSGTSSVSRGGR